MGRRRRGVRERRDAALRPKQRAAFATAHQSYGYLRMTVEPREQSEPVANVRAPRLTQEEGLSGRPFQRYSPDTTRSNHDGPIADHRLAGIQMITGCDNTS